MKRSKLNSRQGASALIVAALSVLGVACTEEGAKPWAMRHIKASYTFPVRDAEGSVVPDGETYSAAELEQGRHSYVHYCYACHGMNGDGKGPAAPGLNPPPRDFRLGAFKFGAVRSGELPNNEDFIRIVQGGLHGTAMLEWDISHDELWLIVQFLKTFPKPACDPFKADDACKAKLAQYPDGQLADGQQPNANGAAPSPWEDIAKGGKLKGKLRPTGEAVLVKPDPWAGKVDEAIAKGAELYHLKAQCANCHPGFLTYQEFSAAMLKADANARPSFRDSLYASIVVEADKNPYGVNLLPPDFTLNPLRSIRRNEELNDLYRLIASGVGGVMPQWVDALSTEEIWAIAHYIKSLKDLALPENRTKRNALKDKLAGQPAYVPPPPPAEVKPAEAPVEGAATAPGAATAAPEAKPAATAAPHAP